MSSTYYHLYVSVADADFSDQALSSLLEKSRAANTQRAVTGLLVYKAGNFMQILEGEEATVRTLAQRIARDERHQRVVTLAEGHAPQREFPDWSMGFQRMDKNTAMPEGYSEFMGVELTPEHLGANPSRAWRLLQFFRQT